MNVLIAGLAALLCTCCTPEKPENPKPDPTPDKPGEIVDPVKPVEPIEVSSIRTTKDGKVYLEVDGDPFPIYGAQIRIDIFRSVDKMEWSEIEPYFATAKKLGLNCVQLSYPWAFLEPNRDKYSFDEIDRLLSYANKYDLKIELLWFSTNMIGDSYTYLVPDYILSLSPLLLKRDGDGWFHDLYGYVHSVELNNPIVLERETLAVTTLFNHIRDWDASHGDKHPVISCQVHNEPDGMVRWRLDEKNISHRDGTKLTYDECWTMTLEALDAVGKAIKASDYKVATRTNLIYGDGINDFPQTPGISPKDVFNLEGIDFVSFDPYRQEVNQLAKEVSAYASLKGNYPLVAENRGDFSNTASLILTTSALGGGYDIYDLATSPHLFANGTMPFKSEGIFNSDLTPKKQVKQVNQLLSALVGAAKDVALTPTADFAAFNIVTDNPQKNCNQTICTSGAKLTLEMTDAALAFVLDRGDRLVAWSGADAKLTIEGGTTPQYANGVVTLNANQLTEISYSSAGKQSSTTKKFIGTIFK